MPSSHQWLAVMVIDALALLYTDRPDAFGIVSSDADFTPLVMHLLSPAQRPVQVTRDLESFWNRGYAEVRKELKGRYPKHYWPDDPRQAVATHRARPVSTAARPARPGLLRPAPLALARAKAPPPP